MKKILLILIAFSIAMILGCEKKKGSVSRKSSARQRDAVISNTHSSDRQPDPDKSYKQASYDPDHSSNGDTTASSGAKDFDKQQDRGISSNTTSSQKLPSQQTIRDDAESEGREMDNFEEQMDRLQAAVEGLLED